MPTLVVEGGAALHYEESGAEGGLAPVVFAHGLLWSGRMFAPQVAALGARRRCVTFDFRGQGRSAITDGGYDMDTLTGDAAALIERLGLAPCHFVGLSMGGFVGMRLAARRPELLRSLALLETAADGEPRWNVPKYRLMALVARAVGVGPLAPAVMRIMFGRSFLADPARAAERAALEAELRGLRVGGMVRALDGVIRRAPLGDDELARIRAPTLVLSGAEDRAVVPERSRRTAARIPGARFELLARGGHTSTLEAPELVTMALERFLEPLG